jgi:hypothetical protein
MIFSVNLKSDQSELYDSSFGIRAASALGISIIADGLDYVGAPIFAMPVIGDIADLFVAGLLYRITKSKVSVAINAIEFIPFIGDFIPTYTISTLLWILNESRKRNRARSRRQDEPTRNIVIQNESLQTRVRRAYAILRSRA